MLCLCAAVLQHTPMAMHCCATMLVSRERILMRPLEMYQALYRWLERTVGAVGVPWYLCCLRT